MIRQPWGKRIRALAVNPAVWMMLLSLLPACSKGQPPDKVAQLMVDTARNEGGSALDNLSNAPAQELAAAIMEWSTAMEAVLGERPHAMTTLEIVTRTGELYRDGVFQPKESSKYAARVRAISKDRLASWRTAVDQLESGVDGPNVLWFMVRQPAMFEGSSLRPGAADRQLKRLRALPADAVTHWATLTDVSNGPAAFVLIQVDSLFQDAVFKPSVFDAALPHAKRLLHDDVNKK